MTKIKEIIKITGGYTDVIDLTNHYSDPKINAELMARYKPIKAHREAFGKLSEALDQQNKRFYFLSGSFGTGKSHLSLMAANYFSRESSTLEMKTFFDNYRQAQKDVQLKPGESLNEKSADDLIAKRKHGKYLVAICRYGLNLEFEGTILRAVDEALKESGLELDTHFKEAIRKIDEWEKKKNDKRFYGDLEKELSKNYPELTIQSLTKGLKEAKEDSFQIFKELYKEVTSADFVFDKDNLQNILKDILTNENFKEKFKGLVIIYDEFGYALDGNKVNLSKMQEFAQFCAQSKMSHHPVIFIGTGHKPFRNHGQVGDAVHFDTISARVIEIPLQTQGMEDIIGAIVSPDKDSKLWKENVEPNDSLFTFLSGECSRINIFDWLKTPIIENNIVRNIYPMHPLATYGLLQLAKEVGSDNRSIFQFFSPRINSVTGEWESFQHYSYPWFIAEHDIKTGDKLNFYTTDLLYDYFKDGMTSDNRKMSDTPRQALKNYKESLRTFKRYLVQSSEDKLLSEDDADELFYKILKAILINEMISTEKTTIPNTKENIFFALNAVTEQEKGDISRRLELLQKIGVVFLNNNVYELRKSDAKDIQRMVDDYKTRPENHPSNLLTELKRFVPFTSDEEFLVAKEYNITYNEDKRLKNKFVTVEELAKDDFIVEGEKLNFFEKCVSDRKAAGYGKDGYEGTAIFVFCQSDEEIRQAKELAKKNNVDEIAIAIPKSPFNILNEIQTLLALESIKQSEDYKNFGSLENSQINEIQRNTLKNLKSKKDIWFDNGKVDWMLSGGRIISLSNHNHDIANKIIETKFVGKRNKFSHTDFNKSHINLSGTTKRIFNEAVDILLDLSESIKIEWNLPENRGSRRYIQKCFVDRQLIKLIKSEGDFRYFEPETDVSKFKDIFPAYIEMINDIESIEGKEWINFNSLFNKYFEIYGLGEIAVTLLFLLLRRYYGDSIRIKQVETSYTDLIFNSNSVPLELITGNYPNAVIKYEPLSAEQKKYFHIIHKVFEPQNTSAGDIYGIADAYSAIKSWWSKLPTISKIKDFYKHELLDLWDLINIVESADPYKFIKKDLIEILGYEENEILKREDLDIIESKLSEFKSSAENIIDEQQNEIRKELKNIFNAETATDIDIVEAVRNWFNNDLDNTQKDPFASFHNNDSKGLIKKIRGISNQTEFIFSTLPESFGLGRFVDWQIDKKSDFINKIISGKKHIEMNASKVGDLSIDIKGKHEIEDNKIKHKGVVEIVVDTSNDSDEIYYTEDGSDPTDENSQRKKIKKGEKIPVYGNKTIRLVVKEPHGHYGKIKTYETIDESQKCKIKKSKDGFFGDDTISFVYPQDENDFKVIFDSLLEEFKSSSLITLENLRKIINNTFDKLK